MFKRSSMAFEVRVIRTHIAFLVLRVDQAEQVIPSHVPLLTDEIGSAAGEA